MPVPLLTTKLLIPPAGKRVIDRPRLLAGLDECLHPGCRLALVSAPAGFGKTTLVAAWALAAKATEPDLSIAWLSIENGDNDPVIFWAYLISALQTRLEGIGEASLGMLQTSQVPDLERNLAALINELASISHPFVLILDDYHLIRNPAIQRSLSFFLEHVPPPVPCGYRLAHRPSPSPGAAPR